MNKKPKWRLIVFNISERDSLIGMLNTLHYRMVKRFKFNGHHGLAFFK